MNRDFYIFVSPPFQLRGQCERAVGGVRSFSFRLLHTMVLSHGEITNGGIVPTAQRSSASLCVLSGGLEEHDLSRRIIRCDSFADISDVSNLFPLMFLGCVHVLVACVPGWRSPSTCVLTPISLSLYM